MKKINEVDVIYDVYDFPFIKLNSETIATRRKKSYIDLFATFDIETTTITDCEKPFGYMYIWQMCVGEYVCMGRTWTEFQIFMQKIKDRFFLSKNRVMVIYVHYLTYEFQFFRNFFEIERVFATDNHNVVTVDIEGYEFRCSYRLSNMSLDSFLKKTKGVTHFKTSGKDFDYKKKRTPNTALSDDELQYCYNDVKGLHEAIETLLEDDSLVSIPLTSTGYVRRDCRVEMAKNADNRKRFTQKALTAYQYSLCQLARRGGNTHAGAILADEILTNVYSYDITSSYPFEIMTNYAPANKYVRVTDGEKNLDRYVNRQCVLFNIELSNLSLRNLYTIPYIAKAKCLRVSQGRYDNGRVLTATRVNMIITEIDWQIIERQYKWDDMTINDMYVCDRAPFSRELRIVLMQYFSDKTKLKKVDEYLYHKSKNKLNAIFGMMLTDIVHDEYVYTAGENPFDVVKPDIERALKRHYASKSAFLSYQDGLYVTAHARAHLQRSIDATLIDTVYVDTDSNKHIGDHSSFFEEDNNLIIEKAESYDVSPYVDYNGKKIYLGTWEYEGIYTSFKTLGAKKYAYEKDGKFGITVAGLNKQDGATFIGDISNFKTNLIVPTQYSGRTVSYYNDVQKPYHINIDGEDILTASNVGIVNTTYTLGMTTEYSNLLKDFKKIVDK